MLITTAYESHKTSCQKGMQVWKILIIPVFLLILILSLVTNIQSVSANDLSDQENLVLFSKKNGDGQRNIVSQKPEQTGSAEVNLSDDPEVVFLQTALGDLDGIEAEILGKISVLEDLKREIEELLVNATGEEKELLSYKLELIAEREAALLKQTKEIAERRLELQIELQILIDQKAKNSNNQSQVDEKQPKDPKDKQKDLKDPKDKTKDPKDNRPDKVEKIKEPVVKEPNDTKVSKEAKEDKK